MCHSVSIFPNVGTTWVILETSIEPKAILGSRKTSDLYIVNSEVYVIFSPCHSKQTKAISETFSRTLKVPEKRIYAKRKIFLTVTTVRFVSDNLWRPVLPADGWYKISHALICAEWLENRDNSLIIANQMKCVSLNSEQTSSTGTRAPELNFPGGSSTSYCMPDHGPSVKRNPSKCYPHSGHWHPNKCHFPYFPWCRSNQIGASHHTPSFEVTSKWL